MKHALRLLLLAALPVSANFAGDDVELERVRDRVLNYVEGIEREQIQASGVDGLYEIRDGMAFAYVTPDGRYLVEGDLIDLETGSVMTEVRRNEQRARRVAELSQTSIDFAPVDREAERQVHVFIDVDCQYCTDLHREVPQLNRAGIAVKYLFYPRRGEHSRGFELARKAWCAEDRRSALTRLFEGQSIDQTANCANPVAEHLAAALELGVRGTPMLVLPDGSVHYGYLKASDLQKKLERLDATGSAEADERRGPRK